MKTKFAIGCLVQWYECNIIPEYISTLRKAIEVYDGEVLVDIVICSNQDLEKAIDSKTLENCVEKIKKECKDYTINIIDTIYSVADYRRNFNLEYCDKVDVLMWGESDMLVPSQTFYILDSLHQASQASKYVAFFSTCKMWDKTWEPLEHPFFTEKPFIENDYKNWWSVKYTMTAEEMESINSRTDHPEVKILPYFKFNGCGLVISSEVIKSGINIPKSVFFVHEDTAFMLMLEKALSSIPQYVISNILLVHNRNHPEKRMFVKGEQGDTLNKKRRSNDWYIKANKLSEENCYNLFNPTYKSKTWQDVWK